MATTFVLGAQDIEMALIERIIRQAGHPVVYALSGGRRVHPGTAYLADELSDNVAVDQAIWVECAAPHLPRARVIDHHRPGDPGYDHPPKLYWEGSALGQVCRHLRVSPSRQLRLAAAADHCLAAAYRGECPRVTPKALRDWRLANRAHSQRISLSRAVRNLESACTQLRSLEIIQVGDHAFRNALDSTCPDITEASAILGEPIMYAARDRRSRRIKISALNAPPDALHHWMHQAPRLFGLQEVYGNPIRGYAGGYLPEHLAH